MNAKLDSVLERLPQAFTVATLTPSAASHGGEGSVLFATMMSGLGIAIPSEPGVVETVSPSLDFSILSYVPNWSRNVPESASYEPVVRYLVSRGLVAAEIPESNILFNVTVHSLRKESTAKRGQIVQQITKLRVSSVCGVHFSLCFLIVSSAGEN